ncbi:E3 ubiquitin-protein ligase TRIM45-like [Ruditapes philippinarum]|uniref:E3 ubiquitin-protein ligase TRIM45-like n=1 Tax=Ruditapes philippinarum TaxID=129788 RepID=UPI00295A7328|nr:E3 ubiquitin-protein ligase TRIM45-like [Ruditapes philippinarum]XP_060556711.1 E3 ubiquitin-protein ligase TRIM45-like [Ruditapes philippinarum]
MATPDVLQTTSSMTENFTICGLCQETFRRPKVLTCLHTFCYECLNDHIEKVLGPSKHRQFSCPSCDMDIELPALAADGHYADNLKDDQFMTTLVELKKALHEDKSCDICMRGEEKVTAVNWCSDCNDALCESCSKVHLHSKITSAHAVSSLEEMRKMPLETIMRKKNKVNCDRHGENITLFCVDCKDPLCVQCLAVSHRRCENVITVTDAATTRNDIDNIMETLRSLQLSLDSVDGVGHIEAHLEESIENSKHEIMYLSNSLCARIRDQEKFLLKQLDSKASDARKLLKDRTEPRKLQMKTAKSASQRMNNLLKYGSDVEVLMAFNQIRKQIDDYNAQVGDINPERLKVKLEFFPDEGSLTYLDEMKTLGELRIDTGADDGISCWGVTCTVHDDIIVTDCKNKRIQKFSKTGELVDHIQLDDEPRDITTCGNGSDVAVPLIGRLIIFISTRKSLTLIKKTKTERQYDGISYSETESYLVTSCMRERCIDIIQLDGEVLKSIVHDNTGEPLFEEPRYLSASIDGTIIVSDIGLNAVKCIDSRGHCIYTYKGHNDLKNPQGVCVDKIGNIFIADNSNDRIQLLTSNGVFQRYVLVKDSGLERPCAVMISGSSRLIIVQNDGMVKVYTYC